MSSLNSLPVLMKGVPVLLVNGNQKLWILLFALALAVLGAFMAVVGLCLPLGRWQRLRVMALGFLALGAGVFTAGCVLWEAGLLESVLGFSLPQPSSGSLPTVFFFTGEGVLLLLTLLYALPLGRESLGRFLPPLFFLILDSVLFLWLRSPEWSLTFAAWAFAALFLRGIGLIRRSLSSAQAQAASLDQREKLRTYLYADRAHAPLFASTLTSIYYLCEENPEEAMDVTKKLSTYLQIIFSSLEAKNSHPFDQEMELVRSYLTMEDMRRKDWLSVSFDTPFTIFSLPPLAVLTLVQVSMEYSKRQKLEKKELGIQTRSSRQYVEISVLDSAPSFTMVKTDAELGENLSLLQERLQVLAGGTLSIGDLPGDGSMATIRLPRKRKTFLPVPSESLLASQPGV